MDHLSGVDRHSYDSLEGTHKEEEKELKEVRGMGEVGSCGDKGLMHMPLPFTDFMCLLNCNRSL